jgi:hypothetical protein
MGIISWIIFGLITGWVASEIVNKTGSGMMMDIALGVIGAIVSGFSASFRPRYPNAYPSRASPVFGQYFFRPSH